MGDNFVTYGFPFVDVQNGGSVSGMIAGIAHVLNTIPADAKIIPGHGPISTPGDLRKFMEMLRDTRSLVSEAVKKGNTVAQMKSGHLLAKYEQLGKRFVKTDEWIEVLYADVTNSKTGELKYQNHGHGTEHAP
jgi:glyoxylase-like metal-dependent hydrolase (beta-lactamase superfamily II)